MHDRPHRVPPDGAVLPTAEWLNARPRMPFFCEENVWKICLDAPAWWDVQAVVISNAFKTVAMWQQRAAPRDPIIWDYHVVAITTAPHVLVLDADTRDHIVTPLDVWLQRAFRAGVHDAYAPRFRVLGAAVYADVLASDRRHMRDAHGVPLRPFPPWPPPHPARPGTLMRLIDPSDPLVTPMIALEALAGRFGIQPPPLNEMETP